jgi:hypothetical protein
MKPRPGSGVVLAETGYNRFFGLIHNVETGKQKNQRPDDNHAQSDGSGGKKFRRLGRTEMSHENLPLVFVYSTAKRIDQYFTRFPRNGILSDYDISP